MQSDDNIKGGIKKKDSVTYSILFNYFVSYMCPLDVQIVLIKNKHLCNESYNMTSSTDATIFKRYPKNTGIFS